MAKLTLTVRLHDPEEKQISKRCADWIVQQVDREDLELSPEAFVAKYMTPVIHGLEQFKVRV